MLVLILYWLTFSSEYISYYLLSFFSIVIIWNPRKYLTCIYLILLTTPPSFEYRYGSANISFMASALILPLGNLVFALPFVPGSMPLKDSDIAGLLVLLFGLYVYRFGNTNQCCTNMRRINPSRLCFKRCRAISTAQVLLGLYYRKHDCSAFRNSLQCHM